MLKTCSLIKMNSKKKPTETMYLRPCETISKRSRKKRCVVPKEAEAETEAEAEANEEEEAPVIMIDEGDHLDVKAFLSSKYRDYLITTKGGEVVPIDSLEGKYVVVSCFLLPFDLDSIETSICRCIEALFAQLSVQGIADSVKLVVVGKVAPRSRVANFDRFFRMLSLNCLAIPYSDSKSRDRVCKTLELSEWDQPCLVVHPNGKVLQLSDQFLTSYGAQSFPFTEQHCHNIVIQDEIIKNRIRSINSPVSLGELLQCDSLSQIADGNTSIPTSDLDQVVVGIYLCFDGFRKGGFMFDLQDIHRKCLDKGYKFEIVLIPVPFGRYSDPISFYDRIKKSALKNTTSSSWWTISFSDIVCRSLWRLFYCDEKDELIILPRRGCPGDLYGRHMATVYGADAYPFTTDVIVEKKVK
ncbi:putative nucleoredoxin 1 [Silene latifolia]|uniref:putative nucleoredoxin 1 n=1 Tax=Silene latifolia TaxID=37657 RepID=UPI003D76D27E